ncbi:hypothetical protein [Microtetraspora malaysiensis]|uniref:hypothetical protein n=1 Tax=Microtetraspora malaysiensis TaxID=161358 RepID=UPI000B295E1A|nr:hypothetical protein [Microtetraspora malaysiensis]
MFRKLPGDEARNLVSTTPDTAVVFRPAVVRTPALVTIVIWLSRLVAGLVRLVRQHPIAVTILAVPGVIWTLYGWPLALVFVGLAILAGLSWASLNRASFLRVIGWRLLAFWRPIWIYRRHWQPVMIVSGLGRHLCGRDYLPHLLRVHCDGWADRVTVKMLNGQAVKDWTDRAEHLAHGFGPTAASWKHSPDETRSIRRTPGDLSGSFGVPGCGIVPRDTGNGRVHLGKRGQEHSAYVPRPLASGCFRRLSAACHVNRDQTRNRRWQGIFTDQAE